MKIKLEAVIKSLTDSVKNKDWAYGPAVQSVLDALSATDKHSGELEQSLNVANTATQAWKQRAKAAEASVGVLEGIIARKEFDSQKGEQAPYGFIDPNAETGGMWVKNRAREGDQFTAPIFTVPQKPIISKEKLGDWLEDNFDINDSQRAAFAACFAHCCDCIVQSHSPAPVGEIVAWSGTDREKGITREVDFRFLRFDVLPGTKLYAGEPAPTAKSDLLTRAEALAVETRALASRIKAAE